MGGEQKTTRRSRLDRLADKMNKIKKKTPKSEDTVKVRKKIDNMYTDAKEESDVSERAKKLLQAGLEYKKAGLNAEAEKACNEALTVAENNSGTFNEIVSEMAINQIDVKVKVDKPEKLLEDVKISDEERKPELVVGDEDVSDDELTAVPGEDVVEEEEETEEARYEDETRAGEEARPVSESQIEAEKRLSEVDRAEEAENTEEAEIMDETEIHEEMQELPFDGEVVLKFVDGEVVLVEEDEGEATQMWVGELEKGEATEEGFGEMPVKNKDLLKLLKGVDAIIESFKKEIEMLEGEKDELEVKLEMLGEDTDETSKDVYTIMSDVDELEGKLKIVDKDLGEVEEVIDDENLKALVRVHVAEELGGKEGSKPKAGPEFLAVLDALKLDLNGGLESGEYLEAVDKCDDKYGEEVLVEKLNRIKNANIAGLCMTCGFDDVTAKIVYERADYVLKEYYSG